MPTNSGLLRKLLTLHWPPRLAIVLCGLLGTFLPAAYGFVAGIPIPKIHDEFSYLLAADTFAQGRLTNPTPELPEFFEAQHVLVAPSYMSKYPPGQGLILAAGQVLCGHPIWGVWLSCGLFASSLCWMVQVWTSPKWANVAAVFAILSFGISSYWAQSYWGGMLAACGGALLFGGLRRTLRRTCISSSMLMALGVVILTATRPYEGILVCLPAGALLCRWLVADATTTLTHKLVRWVCPFGLVMLAGVWANATYNQAVTGNPLRFPYSVHLRQYFHQGVFVFSKPYTPERDAHPWLARFYAEQRFEPVRGVGMLGFKLVHYGTERLQCTLSSILTEMTFHGEGGRSSLLWIGILLLVGMRSRWGGFGLATLVFVIIGQCLVEYWYAHYAAPVVPLVLAVLAEAVRRISLSRPRSWPTGSWQSGLINSTAISLLVVGFALANFGGAVVVGMLRLAAPKYASMAEVKPKSDRGAARQDVLARLNEMGGGHLVFVRYDKTYTLYGNWVYNSADLNTSRVIFAHDFGDAKNQELIARYQSRSVWLCTLARGKYELKPYSAQGDATTNDSDRPLEAEQTR